MIKRIVLEELSGLRRIGGTLDLPTEGNYELPKHVEWKGLTCYWLKTSPRFITYREFDPEVALATEGTSPVIPVSAQEST